MNTSERIALLRFPLIVAVVFIHAYGSQIYLSDVAAGTATLPAGAHFAQELISQTIARIAVPLFYAVSGFLFFLTYDGSLQTYRRKMHARVHSLLVPYVIWNSLVILLLAVAQAMPATRDYFSGQNKAIAEFGLLDYVNAYLGHGARRYPIAYPFWFIRDLMVLVLLTPLIRVLLQQARFLTLFLSAVVWCCVGYQHTLLLDPGAWLFFVVGAVLASEQGVLDRVDGLGPVLVLAYLVIAHLDALLGDTVAGMLTHKVGIMIGLAATWYLFGLIRSGHTLESWLRQLSVYAFFVFAAHEPLLTTLKKLSYKLLAPENGISTLAIYFCVPLCTLLVTLTLGVGLHRLAPRLFGIVCGGRATR